MPQNVKRDSLSLNTLYLHSYVILKNLSIVNFTNYKVYFSWQSIFTNNYFGPQYKLYERNIIILILHVNFSLTTSFPMAFILLHFGYIPPKFHLGSSLRTNPSWKNYIRIPHSSWSQSPTFPVLYSIIPIIPIA